MSDREKLEISDEISQDIDLELNQRVFFERYGDRVLRSLRRIIRSVDIYSRKLNKSNSITVPQLICLQSTARLGPLTLTMLAQDVNLGMSTVNGIVDRLEAKKLIVRRRCEQDRRKVLVTVTKQGEAQLSNAPYLLQDKLLHGLQGRPELEQATIALALERVVELMEADHLDASPNLVSEPLPEKEKEPPFDPATY